MKSKISFIDNGIVRNDIRSWGWAFLAYLFALFLSLPLKLFMVYSNFHNGTDRYPEDLEYMYRSYLQVLEPGYSPLLTMLLISVPMIMGMLFFLYLHKSNSADSVHALPVKREALYNSHVLTGLLFLWIPLILAAGMTMLIAGWLNIEVLTASVIGYWLGFALLFSTVFFMLTVLVGVLTGIASAQGIITYIFLIFPMGFCAMAIHNISIYVKGFPADYFMGKVDMLSPLVRFFEYCQKPLGLQETLIYLAIAVLMYFAGKFFYKKRNVEMASNAIAFVKIQPIFVYGVALCSSLLVGSYFYEMQDSMGWTWFGYVLGGFLGYFISRIIIAKSFKVFYLKNFRNFLVYTVVFVLLVLAAGHDFTGYEKRLPNRDEIESVYMDNSFYMLDYDPEPDDLSYCSRKYYEGYREEQIEPLYFEGKNIDHIYGLHSSITESIDILKDDFATDKYDEYRTVCLVYNMKNGSRIYRHYVVPLEVFEENFKAIQESLEYKLINYNVFRISPEDVSIMDIDVNGGTKQVRITDPEEIARGLNALKTDTMNMTYEEMNDRRERWASVVFHNGEDDRGKYRSVAWEKSFTEFGAWLKETGRYEDARITADEIIYAVVVPYAEKEQKEEDMEVVVSREYPTAYRVTPVTKEYYSDIFEYINALEKEGIDYEQVSDPVRIEKYLNEYVYHDENPSAHIRFALKDGVILEGYLAGGDGQAQPAG